MTDFAPVCGPPSKRKGPPTKKKRQRLRVEQEDRQIRRRGPVDAPPDRTGVLTRP